MTVLTFAPVELDEAARERTRASFRTVWDHLVPSAVPPRVDALLCFGSRDRSVARAAAGHFLADRAPWALVTGGARFPDGVTEADRFAEDLVAHGVPADRIVKEERARHTGENVQLGMQVLRARGLDPRSVALVCWPLAARRALATFGFHEPDVEAWAAPSRDDETQYLRASPRVVAAALGEVGRLERYGAAGLINPVPTPPAVDEAARHLRAHLGR